MGTLRDESPKEGLPGKGISLWLDTTPETAYQTLRPGPIG